MERSHLEQARFWLQASEYIRDRDSQKKERFIVSVAMAIHAIIKANDALTYSFLRTTARRHDEARKLFESLIKENRIRSEFSANKQIIQDAINNKSKAEYKIHFFSKKDADDMCRKAEKFISRADNCLTRP